MEVNLTEEPLISTHLSENTYFLYFLDNCLSNGLLKVFFGCLPDNEVVINVKKTFAFWKSFVY